MEPRISEKKIVISPVLLGLLIFTSLLAHFLFVSLGQTSMSHWHWDHEPFHAFIEGAGSFSALLVAFVLLRLEKFRKGTSFNIQIAAALVGMGVIDGFHAAVHVGNIFVWFHSIAVFIGGVLFSLVWIPFKGSSIVAKRWVIFIFCLSTAICLYSLFNTDQIPSMVQQGNFTILAKSLNLIGGGFFVLAALRLVLSYWKTKNVEDLLFVIHCILFGSAAIMFESSKLWDFSWWGWHLLRLLAYVVALWFVYLSHHRTVQEAQDTELFRAQESYFETIIEGVAAALILVGPKGKIHYVNQNAQILFGYSKQEFLKMSVEDLLPEKYRSGHVHLREHFFKNPSRRSMGQGRNLYGLTKDGQEIHIEVGLSPVMFKSEQYVLAAIYDISYRKSIEDKVKEQYEKLVSQRRSALNLAQDANEAKEELEKQKQEILRSNQELEQFAYVASHDLQEPIRKIVGFSQLFEKVYEGEIAGKPKEYMEYMVDGARRMQLLVQDLLQYSRAGSTEMTFEEVNFNGVIKEAVNNLDMIIKESGAQVHAKDLPTIRAHRIFMTRLFQNLIGNAIKYRSEKAPEVNISAEKKNHVWEFTVQDNGIGIDPEFADKIFVIFQRLHGKGEYEGTGIGLAVCRRMIEKHGGKIWLDTSAKTQGTTFKFTLPIKGV